MIFILTIALALFRRSSTVSASYQQRGRYSNVLGVSIGQLSEKYNFLLCEQARCKQSFCGLVRNTGQVRHPHLLFQIKDFSSYKHWPGFLMLTYFFQINNNSSYKHWPGFLILTQKNPQKSIVTKGGVHLNPNDQNPRKQSLTRERKWTQCETYCWNIYWGLAGNVYRRSAPVRGVKIRGFWPRGILLVFQLYC